VTVSARLADRKPRPLLCSGVSFPFFLSSFHADGRITMVNGTYRWRRSASRLPGMSFGPWRRFRPCFGARGAAVGVVCSNGSCGGRPRGEILPRVLIARCGGADGRWRSETTFAGARRTARNGAWLFGGWFVGDGGRNASVKVFAPTARSVSSPFSPLPASGVVREAWRGGVGVWSGMTRYSRVLH